MHGRAFVFGSVICVALLAANLTAQSAATEHFPSSEKQQVLWQKLESSIQELSQKVRSPDPTAQANPEDPVAQGMGRYHERLLQLIQPQRSGTTITCLHVDGQNPAQQQLVSAVIVAAATKIQSEKADGRPAKGKRVKVVKTANGTERFIGLLLIGISRSLRGPA
jgi:hypothetical protein